MIGCDPGLLPASLGDGPNCTNKLDEWIKVVDLHGRHKAGNPTHSPRWYMQD
jgi:hypothetical protein